MILLFDPLFVITDGVGQMLKPGLYDGAAEDWIRWRQAARQGRLWREVESPPGFTLPWGEQFTAPYRSTSIR